MHNDRSEEIDFISDYLCELDKKELVDVFRRCVPGSTGVLMTAALVHFLDDDPRFDRPRLHIKRQMVRDLLRQIPDSSIDELYESARRYTYTGGSSWPKADYIDRSHRRETRRPEQAEVKERTPIDLSKISGTWMQDQGDAKVILVLGDDGTFIQKFQEGPLYLRAMGALLGDLMGTWTVTDGNTLNLRAKLSKSNLFRWTKISWVVATREWLEENIFDVSPGDGAGDFIRKIVSLTEDRIEFEGGEYFERMRSRY